MATRSRFFDSVAGDRVYTSDAWAQILQAISSNGYIPGYGSLLGVTETPPPTMGVSVGLGAAMVQGRFFEVYSAAETVALSPSNPTNPRIDRIVVRLDLSSGVRSITLAALAGTPAAVPTPPALTRNTTTYELSLAQVRVNAGVTSVTNANITGERNDASVCGMAVPPGLGAHTHSGSESPFINQYKDHIETLTFDNGQYEAVQFFLPRAPVNVQVMLRGRPMRAGLLASHNHGGALTSGAVSADHTHAFTTAGASADHVHAVTVNAASISHVHAVNTSAGDHQHVITHSNTGGVGYQLQGTGNVASDTQFQSVAGGHTHGNTSATDPTHAHTTTVGGRSADHTHAGNTGGISANHSHVTTVPTQGVAGFVAHQFADGITANVNGAAAFVSSANGLGAAQWDLGPYTVTANCAQGWNTLYVTPTLGGLIKVHVLMTF